jgi:hypothetical protein
MEGGPSPRTYKKFPGGLDEGKILFGTIISEWG